MASTRVVLPDAEALALHAAGFVADTLAASTGRVAICLSGGSTPKRLYEHLAAAPFRDRIPWARVEWFWGDERFVPPDHPDSNARMARLALLSHVPAPAANVHPIPTLGCTPEESARTYEYLLQTFYGGATLDPSRPLFEIVLLGLGEDGHTASLFPGVAALAETQRWTAAVIGAKPEPRITLTFPALGSARHVVFLAAGANKLPVLERLAAGADLPAGRVRTSGELHWMIDRAAAGDLA